MDAYFCLFGSLEMLATHVLFKSKGPSMKPWENEARTSDLPPRMSPPPPGQTAYRADLGSSNTWVLNQFLSAELTSSGASNKAQCVAVTVLDVRLSKCLPIPAAISGLSTTSLLAAMKRAGIVIRGFPSLDLLAEFRLCELLTVARLHS
jgi:hypothetical protein